VHSAATYLLSLHPDDNVLTVIAHNATTTLPIGHKVAARPIAAGEHVHTHNVQSDYIPTYLREDQGKLFGAKTI
jgi:hypothetical protein